MLFIITPWFGCIRITFLLNRMVWFDLRFLFYQPNQTKPNRNIRKTLINYMSYRQNTHNNSIDTFIK